MKRICAVVAMLAVAVFFNTAFSADLIELQSGTRKMIFNHKKHKDILKDCKKCHENGAGGKIVKLDKRWVHEVNCKKCHVDMAAAGLKTGPVSCKGCHK